MWVRVLFALLGSLAAEHVWAQTWEQPFVLFPVSTSTYDSCAAQNNITSFDGLPSMGPDVVYEFLVLRHLPHPYPGGPSPGNAPPHSALLTLVPLYPSSRPDFAILVCRDKIGSAVFNCAQEDDDVANPGQPVQIVIPPEDLSSHIVVVSGLAGSADFSGGCGAYTLVVD